VRISIVKKDVRTALRCFNQATA